MSSTTWHLLVVGHPRGRDRSLASADQLDDPPSSVAVAEPEDPTPWEALDSGPVVFLRSGDEVVADALERRLGVIATDPASIGGHHNRGGRWGTVLPPDPAGLRPTRLLLHCPVELSGLTVERSLLPDDVEIAPDRPGGDRWLLSHLARSTPLAPLAVPVATVLTRPHAGVESAAAIAATRLVHELGVASAVRTQLMEQTWLAAEGPTTRPERWWAPVVERGDAAEIDQLFHDLEQTLDHLNARLRATVGGVDAIVADHGTPQPPNAWYLAGDHENALLEIEHLRQELELLQRRLEDRTGTSQ